VTLFLPKGVIGLLRKRERADGGGATGAMAMKAGEPAE
jgi:hypothetical protein